MTLRLSGLRYADPCRPDQRNAAIRHYLKDILNAALHPIAQLADRC